MRAAARADPRLPVPAEPVVGAAVPLRADLLGVRDRGDRAARRAARQPGSPCAASARCHPWHRGRLRPRSLKIPRTMMDTQRLIAFVVFSFSALLLWDAWQKHNAPKAVAAPPRPRARRPACPQPTARRSPRAPAAPGARPRLPRSRRAARGAAPAAGGEPITVKTDLFEVELNTLGGDIRRVTLLQVFSATRPHQAAHADGAGLRSTTSSRSRACWARACRPTRPPYAAEATRVRAAAGQGHGRGAPEGARRGRRRGREALPLPSRQLPDRRRLRGHQPQPTSRSRRTRTSSSCATPTRPREEAAQTNAFAGVTTFTGPAVYTEASEVREGRLQRHRQGQAGAPEEAQATAGSR